MFISCGVPTKEQLFAKNKELGKSIVRDNLERIKYCYEYVCNGAEADNYCAGLEINCAMIGE